MSPRDVEEQQPSAPSSMANGDALLDSSAANVENGVGSVGTDRDELSATPAMCQYCFDVLIEKLVYKNQLYEETTNEILLSRSNNIKSSQSDFLDTLPPDAECPLFVTWDKEEQSSLPTSELPSSRKSGTFMLRGCIGTLMSLPLRTALGEYAQTSAFRDRRFHPISTSEVPKLRVAVSLLVNYETCAHCHDWSVGTHGIIIKFTHGSVHYNATFLPEVAFEQGWNQHQTIESLVRKAGFRGELSNDFFAIIHCTRYQSSKHRMTYDDYVYMTGQDHVADALAADIKSKSKQHRWRPCFNL